MKLNRPQKQLLNTAAKISSNCFETLQKKLDTDTLVGKFIHDILGDYLYEIIYSVKEDPDYQITEYFNNDFNGYINQILTDSLRPRIAIINCLKIYFKNYDELSGSSLDEISDQTSEYYNSLIGPNLTSNSFSYEFTNLQLALVNGILASLNFKPIERT